MFEELKKRREKAKFKEENKEQKQFASENRKTGEKVAFALENARSSVAGISDPKKQLYYRSTISQFADKIRNCDPNAYCDTSNLDAKLKLVADEYSRALKFGDLKAAEGITDRIQDLIDERKKLGSCLKDDAEDEIEKVDKLADGTLTLAKYYGSLRVNKNNYRLSTEAFEKAKIKYKKQFDETQKMEKADPDAADLLESFIPGKGELTESAKKLARSRRDLKADYQTQETARITSDIMKKQESYLEQFIDNLSLILKQKDSRLNDETIEKTMKILSDYANNLKGVEDEIAKLTEVSEYFERLMANIDNDIRDEEYYVEVGDWYQRMLAEKERQEASLAKGRKLQAERENEQPNENRMMNEN